MEKIEIPHANLEASVKPQQPYKEGAEKTCIL